MKDILLITFASVNLLLSRFALVKLKQPGTVALWLIKVFVSAISPVLLALALCAAVAGFIFHSTPIAIVGTCSFFLYVFHIVQITRAPDSSTGFESCFGRDWNKRIPAMRRSLFLSRRYVFWLPKSSPPIFEKDISFYIIPSTRRALLCDIWQPPAHQKRSGLAFIYLHGSAWTMLDKDYGTRTFFSHLASQGHVIMDVAYRLFPETDFTGMVHDAKRAIAWLKANANVYGIDPGKIIIGGGSAGAHLAMLAAYTASSRKLTPPDLQQHDLRVCGVISSYGQSDLIATFYHNRQDLMVAPSRAKTQKPRATPSWIQKIMGKDFHRLGFDKEAETGRLIPIIGGTPDEVPDAYALFSPISHVHNDCPPTFIIHGKQDILAPVKAIHELHSRLKKAGVPVVMHLLPQTDHGFDLVLTRISPSAHNAIYDVERFMAIMEQAEQTVKNTSEAGNTVEVLAANSQPEFY